MIDELGRLDSVGESELVKSVCVFPFSGWIFFLLKYSYRLFPPS